MALNKIAPLFCQSALGVGSNKLSRKEISVFGFGPNAADESRQRVSASEAENREKSQFTEWSLLSDEKGQLTVTDIPRLDRIASVNREIIDYYERHNDLTSKTLWVNEFRQAINRVLRL